ncbi:5-oxoprolinase subunit PxpA [Pedobacter sp. GSP4]|uniref:5-oxoprolinase subunit PxpA n=1 Tax=Pedobacter sp. GSP4 TaxID=3453716 RepID=UPI003EECC6D2
MMKAIDINCDMGEAFGKYPMPGDEILMDYITSANIACGFHAGDPQVMQQTVNMAISKGVAIGAHPGLPDLQGFGRREINVTPAEVYQMTVYQIAALYGFVKVGKGTLHHVKPHGALYNMAAKNYVLAEAIAQAVYDFDSNLILYALAGSEMISAARKIGLVTASEVFADRSYQDDGSLTPRNRPDALITNELSAIEQVLMMVKQQQVISTKGNAINLAADTLCIHGDGEHAISFAKMINQKLKNEGIMLKTVS